MNTLNLSGLPFASMLNSYDDEFVHNHEFYECFYISEGSIYHEINGQTTLLNIGDAVIIAPGITHTFHRIPGKNCSHRDNMISTELFLNCCNFLDKGIADRLKTNGYIEFFMPSESLALYEQHILSYITSNIIAQRLKFEKNLVTFLLGYIVMPMQKHIMPTNDFQAKCITVINSRFTSHDAVKEVYDELKFNKSYLSKRFKDSFGVTLTEYINELKIKHAAYLLSVTEMTIPAICDMVGIESIPYFHKLFKKYYGTTPRKSHANL
ncbi:MAG: AraC family transcriptional regulator [Clostridia bacterium]|nr:AraC family transcriptional regulator [Clostridia bacterium]